MKEEAIEVINELFVSLKIQQSSSELIQFLIQDLLDYA